MRRERTRTRFTGVLRRVESAAVAGQTPLFSFKGLIDLFYIFYLKAA